MPVTYDSMPQQGWLIARRVRVCFNFDLSRQLMGTIVRHDIEEP